MNEFKLRQKITMAMEAPDDYVLALDYRDVKGDVTSRMVSPIRYIGLGMSDRISALCLCREEPRTFSLHRMSNVRVVSASEILMPVALKEKSKNPWIRNRAELMERIDKNGVCGNPEAFGGYLMAVFQLEDCPKVTTRSVWRNCKKESDGKLNYPFTALVLISWLRKTLSKLQ